MRCAVAAREANRTSTLIVLVSELVSVLFVSKEELPQMPVVVAPQPRDRLCCLSAPVSLHGRIAGMFRVYKKILSLLRKLHRR